MNKFVKLNFKKAQKYIWDYKEYMATFDAGSKDYKLAIGAPKIININGHYVEIHALPNICVGRMSKSIVSRAMRQHTLGLLEYKWIIQRRKENNV